MTGARPRLLFLCQALPFPPDAGPLIRGYNILRLLAREYDVTALCFYRRNDRPTPELVEQSVAALGAFIEVEAFEIPQEHSRLRWIADHARSTITRTAYTRFAYDSPAFRARLAELLRERTFDLVHVDSLDLSGYLPMLEGLPVVCVHHNVESQLLERRAGTMSWPASAYLRFQARLTAAEERRWYSRVALNVAVSPEDAASIRAVAPGTQVIVVPNGVDTEHFQPSPEATNGIAFVGTAAWHPNRQAMEFFCEQILADVRARDVSDEVIWIGRAPSAVAEHFRSRFGVQMLGYVDDIRPIVGRARCYVAPLRAGGGTRLKILDAWAMGKAVVSTSVGCEGLDARDGENIIIRDDPREFAAAVAAIVHDPEFRRRLEAGARSTAIATYSWEAIGHSMLPAYGEAARSAVRATL